MLISINDKIWLVNEIMIIFLFGADAWFSTFSIEKQLFPNDFFENCDGFGVNMEISWKKVTWFDLNFNDIWSAKQFWLFIGTLSNIRLEWK